MTIYGPQLILDYLRNDRKLPRSSVPLYSTALEGVVVSLTGFNKLERDNLTRYIAMMSGVVSGDVTEEVTVLVAGALCTKKYNVVGALSTKTNNTKKISTVSSEWVSLLWEHSGARDPIEPWRGKVTVDCRLGVMFGLSVAVDGFTKEELREMEWMIGAHGGVYCEEVKVGVCTHLICAERRGEKYKVAVKWKVFVVTVHWLFDSILKGYCQDEGLYGLPALASGHNLSDVSKMDDDGGNCSDCGGSDEEDKDKYTFISDNNSVTANVVASIAAAEQYYEDAYLSDKVVRGLFHDIQFFLHCSLTARDRDSICNIITNNGGSQLQAETSASLIVTSETLSVPLPPTSRAVTTYYLHKCVEHQTMLDIHSDFLFSPIIITKNLLTGYVISFGEYTSQERTSLKAICAQLGAIVQDSMVRKALPHKKIKATTHLVIDTIDKHKYQSALNWKVPAVKRLWLAECINKGFIVSIEDYRLLNNLQSTSETLSNISHVV